MPTTPPTAKQWAHHLRRTAHAAGVRLTARIRRTADGTGAYVAWTNHTNGRAGLIHTAAQLEHLCTLLQERQP